MAPTPKKKKTSKKEELEYELEHVWERKIGENGEMLYLTSWLGYEKKTWLRKENFGDDFYACELDDLLDDPVNHPRTSDHDYLLVYEEAKAAGIDVENRNHEKALAKLKNAGKTPSVSPQKSAKKNKKDENNEEQKKEPVASTSTSSSTAVSETPKPPKPPRLTPATLQVNPGSTSGIHSALPLIKKTPAQILADQEASKQRTPIITGKKSMNTPSTRTASSSKITSPSPSRTPSSPKKEPSATPGGSELDFSEANPVGTPVGEASPWLKTPLTASKSTSDVKMEDSEGVSETATNSGIPSQNSNIGPAPKEAFWQRRISKKNPFADSIDKILKMPERGEHMNPDVCTVGEVVWAAGPFVSVKVLESTRLAGECYFADDPCLSPFISLSDDGAPHIQAPADRQSDEDFMGMVDKIAFDDGGGSKRVHPICFANQMKWEDRPKENLFKVGHQLEAYESIYDDNVLYSACVAAVSEDKKTITIHYHGYGDNEDKEFAFDDFHLFPCGFAKSVKVECKNIPEDPERKKRARSRKSGASSLSPSVSAKKSKRLLGANNSPRNGSNSRNQRNSTRRSNRLLNDSDASASMERSTENEQSEVKEEPDDEVQPREQSSAPRSTSPSSSNGLQMGPPFRVPQPPVPRASSEASGRSWISVSDSPVPTSSGANESRARGNDEIKEQLEQLKTLLATTTGAAIPRAKILAILHPEQGRSDNPITIDDDPITIDD